MISSIFSLGTTDPVGLPGLVTIMHLGIIWDLIASATIFSNSSKSILQFYSSFK